MKLKGMVLAAGQIAAQLLGRKRTEESGDLELVQRCAAQFHPSQLSREAVSRMFIFFNVHDPTFLSGVQCEDQHPGYLCFSNDRTVWSNVQQNKRLGKAQVLSYELCARAVGDQDVVRDAMAVAELPDRQRRGGLQGSEAYHPASVLNEVCQRHHWFLERRTEEGELSLVVKHATGELVIPEQRKKVGSGVRHARYMLALQTLQVLAARRPELALVETIARVLRGTSFQYEETVTEEESDTLEYKMADVRTARALQRHISVYLCKTTVGFLNGPLLGSQQEQVKRIVFGISDSLVVLGYQVDMHDRDSIERHAVSLLNTVLPRALFEARFNWIPVLGAPGAGEDYVLEVMVFRKAMQETVVFAEKGDQAKIFIRLGPATYQLGRV